MSYLKKCFSKSKNEKKTISSLKNDEQFKKEFSSWVKEYEKDTKGKQELENFFKNEGTFFTKLTILYFHCGISFPIVDIDFNDIISGMPFNHETMIDFLNKGSNRKVNFVILPSLVSNGNFLENGKYWVFTFKKDTFNVSKLRFEELIDKQGKYKINKNKNDLPISQTNIGENNSKKSNNSKELDKSTKYTSKGNKQKVKKTLGK